MNSNVAVTYVRNYIGNYYIMIKRENKSDITNVNHFIDDTTFFE